MTGKEFLHCSSRTGEMQHQALTPISPFIAHLPWTDVCDACAIPAPWHGQSQGMVQESFKGVGAIEAGRVLSS